jgi:hypothetical protein
VAQPYSATEPISTVSLFEIDACSVALGIFAAQNNRLKRNAGLALDQAADQDSSSSHLCQFRLATHTPPV